MNAFEEGGRIHIDMSLGESVVFPFFPEVNGARFDPESGTRSPALPDAQSVGRTRQRGASPLCR